MSTNEANMAEALTTAISQVFMEHGKHTAKRGLIANWVLVSETLGEDGGLWLNMNHSENSTKWGIIGLLAAASDSYRDTLRAVEGESDDE